MYRDLEHRSDVKELYANFDKLSGARRGIFRAWRPQGATARTPARGGRGVPGGRGRAAVQGQSPGRDAGAGAARRAARFIKDPLRHLIFSRPDEKIRVACYLQKLAGAHINRPPDPHAGDPCTPIFRGQNFGPVGILVYMYPL